MVDACLVDLQCDALKVCLRGRGLQHLFFFNLKKQASRRGQIEFKKEIASIAAL